jgi:hypothetical protein
LFDLCPRSPRNLSIPRPTETPRKDCVAKVDTVDTLDRRPGKAAHPASTFKVLGSESTIAPHGQTTSPETRWMLQTAPEIHREVPESTGLSHLQSSAQVPGGDSIASRSQIIFQNRSAQAASCPSPRALYIKHASQVVRRARADEWVLGVDYCRSTLWLLPPELRLENDNR